MDIENLSKTDIILMALLISFVTAIMTAIVVIFLLEDAPKDIIEIREHFVTTEATSSASAARSSIDHGENVSESKEMEINTNRDEILDRAVKAVARITATDVQPQAGVLTVLDNRDILVTQIANYPDDIQALFKNGVVTGLEDVTADGDVFSLLQVTTASDGINPLRLSNNNVALDDSAFVVPLSQRPEIISVSITVIEGREIKTTAGKVPSTSMLFNDTGGLIGIYNSQKGSFQNISSDNLME
jgi:hypothetical protein